MKNFLRKISFALLAIIIFISSAACSIFDTAVPFGHDDQQIPGNPSGLDDPDTVDLSEGLVPMTRTAPAVPIVLTPVASGRRVEKNSKALIDYSNNTDGYVMVKWLARTDKQLRVQVTGPDRTVYTYIIQPNDKYEVFPLSDGNGKYEIGVFEQVPDGRYAKVLSKDFTVTLKDEFAPFLRPNQYVNFTEDSNTVKKAAELVTGKRSLTDKVAAIYDFVIKTLSYDTKLAEDITKGVVTNYLPDLDSVLAAKKGICFDYAALMTAMLRSQDIPTKLVVGYAGDIRHAWINVYSEESGWIDRVIFFDGKEWTFMDPTFASTATSTSALQRYIGDGSNYLETHLY